MCSVMFSAYIKGMKLYKTGAILAMGRGGRETNL